MGKPSDRGPSPPLFSLVVECVALSPNFPCRCQTFAVCASVSCCVASAFLVVELFFCETMSSQPVITQDEKDVIVELLERYREFRCLWDTTSELYSNRESRNEAFMSLLEIYKKLQPNAVLEGVKKKLENMRSAY